MRLDFLRPSSPPRVSSVSPFRIRRAACASAALVALAGPRAGAQAKPDAARILRDIAYLANPKLEGRLTGTVGNDSAAAYIAARVRSLGLTALSTDTLRAQCRSAPAPASCRTFIQRFTARGAEMAHAGHPEGVPTQNVAALIPGSDPALRGEYIVIGAHFDHLGHSTAGALDPDAKGVIRNGADDNASGTAAVLELARLFAARPARRSIIVASFSGEEEGLLGSQQFVEHAPVALDSIDAMINFDMVGRLRNDKLIIYGVATAAEMPAILDSANTAPRLKVSAVGDGFGPSDHSSFYAKGIPVLHFFTDLHDDYHKASDVVDKINADGEARVVAMAERVVRAIADRPARLTPVRVAAPVAAMGSREGSNVYFGSIPDMSNGDVPGMKLTGVRAGSPADAGGLAAGDIIVQFGGVTVKDLYSYTDALYSHKVGDVVTVVFMRGSERKTTQVTLGKRGQ